MSVSTIINRSLPNKIKTALAKFGGSAAFLTDGDRINAVRNQILETVDNVYPRMSSLLQAVVGVVEQYLGNESNYEESNSAWVVNLTSWIMNDFSSISDAVINLNVASGNVAQPYSTVPVEGGTAFQVHIQAWQLGLIYLSKVVGTIRLCYGDSILTPSGPIHLGYYNINDPSETRGIGSSLWRDYICSTSDTSSRMTILGDASNTETDVQGPDSAGGRIKIYQSADGGKDVYFLSQQFYSLSDQYYYPLTLADIIDRVEDMSTDLLTYSTLVKLSYSSSNADLFARLSTVSDGLSDGVKDKLNYILNEAISKLGDSASPSRILEYACSIFMIGAPTDNDQIDLLSPGIYSYNKGIWSWLPYYEVPSLSSIVTTAGSIVKNVALMAQTALVNLYTTISQAARSVVNRVTNGKLFISTSDEDGPDYFITPGLVYSVNVSWFDDAIQRSSKRGAILKYLGISNPEGQTQSLLNSTQFISRIQDHWYSVSLPGAKILMTSRYVDGQWWLYFTIVPYAISSTNIDALNSITGEIRTDPHVSDDNMAKVYREANNVLINGFQTAAQGDITVDMNISKALGNGTLLASLFILLTEDAAWNEKSGEAEEYFVSGFFSRANLLPGTPNSFPNGSISNASIHSSYLSINQSRDNMLTRSPELSKKFGIYNPRTESSMIPRVYKPFTHIFHDDQTSEEVRELCTKYLVAINGGLDAAPDLYTLAKDIPSSWMANDGTYQNNFGFTIVTTLFIIRCLLGAMPVIPHTGFSSGYTLATDSDLYNQSMSVLSTAAVGATVITGLVVATSVRRMLRLQLATQSARVMQLSRQYSLDNSVDARTLSKALSKLNRYNVLANIAGVSLPSSLNAISSLSSIASSNAGNVSIATMKALDDVSGGTQGAFDSMSKDVSDILTVAKQTRDLII